MLLKSEKRKMNGIRNKKIIMLKKKNFVLEQNIKNYIAKHGEELGGAEMNLLHTFSESIRKCSTIALYGETNGAIRLITPITCDHKLCHICNWNRQKKIRRKYRHWFENNQTLNKVRKTIMKESETKYVTNANLNEYLQSGYALIDDSVHYDLMHLMLTVPHTETGGWRGEKVYVSEIIGAFNTMRHYAEWKDQVHGGEYGVEMTKNENGYHIHIHALLLVRKRKQSRNRLYLDVFRIWNRLTIDKASSKVKFDNNVLEALKTTNRMMTDEYLKKLDPRGSIRIHLQCIYSLASNGEKIRALKWNGDAMVKAVLETISYHYEPMLFNITRDTYDIETIVEVLPKVYRKALYRKFGCLHEEKSLNVKDNSLLEDYEETADDVDEETGEVFQTQYLQASPLHTYVKGDECEIHFHRGKRVDVIPAATGREALQTLFVKSINKK
jgi:hypothetical protein